MCRSLTASWVREKNIYQDEKKNDDKMIVDIEDLDKNLCGYYETFWNKIDGMSMPKGIYTLEDLR